MHSSSSVASFYSSSSQLSTVQTALPLPRKARKVRKRGIERSTTERDSYLVIGGGIAGVSCAKELARLNCESEVVLISASKMLKETKSLMKVTEVLEDLTVFEKRADSFQLEVILRFFANDNYVIYSSYDSLYGSIRTFGLSKAS